MAHSVSEEDGVVIAVFVGPQRHGGIVKVGDEFAKHAKKGVIDKLLLDLSKLRDADLGARRAAGKVANSFYYNRVALMGASPFNNALVTLIAKSSTKVKELQTFETKKKAMEWLLDEKK